MKSVRIILNSYRKGMALPFILLIAGFWLMGTTPQSAYGQGMKQQKMMQMVMKMQQKTPAKGYVKAHQNEKNPSDLLGGAIEISIQQNSGGVFVALPAFRDLDPQVFGTPDLPRAFEGTPGITGVPIPMRGVENNQFTQFKAPSPFGDKFIVLGKGRLKLQAVDATATDAATTKDQVHMEASWQDKEGNTYTIKCCQKLAAHGMEFPTFGGVVTNTILHGFTGIGTPLMPSEFTYFAFWGMGAIYKNGELLEKPRLIHGMLTEYVRKEGYKLAFDENVTPGRQQFHLMVAPFQPDMEKGTFMKSPVKTGFQLPNGMELPFWHVMFETLEIASKRL